MIGTGSTGIQAAPVIAAAAAHLTVFQRTANYSVPARNAPLTPEFRQYIKQHPGEIRAATRETLNGMGLPDRATPCGRDFARGAREDLRGGLGARRPAIPGGVPGHDD
jgi:cation diffusion facilitator CzcD-associated flavoprotein CzcO